MHPESRDATRHEGGFTLIELLVVMIIIAILMAVAVPTFLSQKNNAVKTAATANIKQIVNAIESCSANIPTGGYATTVAPAFDCTTEATLKSFEKGLASLGPIVTANPTVAQYQVVLQPSKQGYMVQTQIQDGNIPVYFAEIHKDDGTILKICSGQALGLGSAAGAVVADSRTCKTGRWG